MLLENFFRVLVEISFEETILLLHAKGSHAVLLCFQGLKPHFAIPRMFARAICHVVSFFVAQNLQRLLEGVCTGSTASEGQNFHWHYTTTLIAVNVDFCAVLHAWNVVV